MPGDQTYEDHLGRTRTVKARNDINWHRTFVWLTGFFYDPKFPLQHLALVAAVDAADALVRQPALPVEAGDDVRRRPGPESHEPLDAGLLAVLGRAAIA
jgi:hypothetical protein